jgi:capsule polysaccharide export protein KpsE/RkpR
LVLTDVFINRYKTVNENRSDAVVKYFTDEVNKAALRLRNAEDQLLEFNKTNNIINYYEQSKAVADMKEKLDQEYNNAMVKFEASAAV